MASSHEPQPSFKCSTCDNSFARQEHLTRHVRIHTQEKPFHCKTCGKRFSRRDVLNRHLASHDEVVVHPMTRASARACKQCAANRVRCSRGQACKRCSERNISCVYPPSKERRMLASHPADTIHESGSILDENSPDYRTMNRSNDAAACDHDPFNPVASVQQEIVTGQEPDTDESLNRDFRAAEESTWATSFATNQFDPLITPPYDWSQFGQDVSCVNWMSHQGQTVHWDALLAEFSATKESLNLPNCEFPFFFNAIEPTHNEDITSNNKWNSPIGTTVTSDIHSGSQAPSEISQTQSDELSHSCGDSTTTSTSTPGKYYVHGTGSRVPFRGNTSSRRAPVNIDTARPGDFGSTPSPAAQLISAATYNKMLDCIRAQSCLEALQLDYASFPSFTEIQLFVKHYFHSFHPVFPFLRKQMFGKDTSDEWVLLLAVSAVGSRYSRQLQGDQPGDVLLDLLWNVLDRVKFGMSLEDDNNTLLMPGEHVWKSNSKMQIIQAGILCVICMLHCGRKAHVRRASLGRYYLVGACHERRYLSYQSTTNNFWDSTKGRDEFGKKWIERESEIRTGMMIWLLDSMFEYELGLKVLMQLDHVKSPLPSSDDSWENSSGTRTPRNPYVTMPEALEMLYMEKRAPADLSEFSVTLLVNAIYRKTREISIREQIGINSWTPTAMAQERSKQACMEEAWPPVTSTMSKWRNGACDSLDALHWLATTRAVRHSGFEHHSILHLHLSRIIILAPTTHIVTLATASSRQKADKPHDIEYAKARDQVLQWVIRDQFKARLSVIHCGALFWHVRRYSCNSIMEPYAIYIATLVLWAFCVSQRLAGLDAFELEPNNEPPCLSSTSSGPPEANHAGMDDHSDPSFLHLDRPIDDELIQAFVQRGHKMSGYIMNVGNIREPTAPRMLLEEGTRLLDKGYYSPIPANQNIQIREKEKLYSIWGIEESYIKSLQYLIIATIS